MSWTKGIKVKSINDFEKEWKMSLPHSISAAKNTTLKQHMLT